MSKDWTPKELAQASKYMADHGYMTYDEFGQELAEQTGVPPMDGFTSKGMHWYLEKIGPVFDLFLQTNADADSYRLICTGTYDECKEALSNE